MKYVEANGCCFNIDEKMKFGFALNELAFDLKLDKVWLVGKVQGKSIIDIDNSHIQLLPSLSKYLSYKLLSI